MVNKTNNQHSTIKNSGYPQVELSSNLTAEISMQMHTETFTITSTLGILEGFHCSNSPKNLSRQEESLMVDFSRLKNCFVGLKKRGEEYGRAEGRGQP